MTTSTYFSNGATTTNQLSTTTGTFVSGFMVASTTNQTFAFTLNQNEYTEHEYLFKFTSNATYTTYCFRLTNAGSTSTFTYTKVAPISVTTTAVGVTISGIVYTNEGTSTISADRTVRIKVNGLGDNYSTTTASDGTYSISNVTINNINDVITVFLDSATYTEKANTITLASSTSNNITGLNLYQNRIIVRHEGATTTNISNLDQYDSVQDSDILFTATSSTGELTASSTSEFFVLADKTFNAWGTNGVGGAISLSDLDIRGTFTATSTQTISVSCKGGFANASCWDATGGTFNSASSTVQFTATSTGKTIVAGSSPFWNLTFNGSGGEWQISTNTLDVNNNLNITLGTLNPTSQDIYIAGNLTLSSGGLFTKGTGTTTFDGSSTNTWIDSNASKQDMGKVVINGSSKTINLGSDIKTTKLIIGQGNAATDKTSRISSFCATGSVSALTFDSANSKIYLGCGGGKFAVYDLSSDTATDKTSKISSFWGTNSVSALTFDSSNTKIYLGGGSGKFAVYDPSSDTATDKTSKISSFWSSNYALSDMTFDSSNTKIYLGGGGYIYFPWPGHYDGKFAVYDPSSDTATDKTSKISGFWGGNYVTALTFDSTNTKIYLGGGYGKFAVYDPSSDTATNKSSKISGFWGENYFKSLTYDSSSSKIYLGGNYCEFAVYDPASDTATDKSSKISSFWSSDDDVTSLTYDSSSSKIYLGGESGNFAVYDPSSDTATDKSSKISSFWGTNYVNALTFDSANTKIYLGGGDYWSRFAVYSPSDDASVPDDTFAPGSYTFTITGSGISASRPFVVNGTFNQGTSLAEFISTSTIDIEATTYYNLKLNQSGTIFQLYYTVTTTNDINIATGTLDVTTANFNLYIGGNWTNTGTFTSRSGTVTFNATTTGKTITTGGSSFYNLTFDGSAGEWSLQDTATISYGLFVQTGTFNLNNKSINVNGGEIDVYSGGTLLGNNPPSSCISTALVTLSGSGFLVGDGTTTLCNLTLSGSGTTNLGEAIEIHRGDGTSGNLTIESGHTFSLYYGYDLLVGGNWLNSGIFLSYEVPVTFNATTTGKTITTGGTSSPFYNLTFNGSGGGWSFASGNHDVNNNFTIAQGSVTSTTGTLYVAGNWSNSGTFTHASGKVVFDGISTSTFSGVTTFYNLTSNTSNKVLQFTAGTSSTTTIAGTLTLNGGSCASSTRIKLRSLTDGSQWYINAQSTTSINYVDVKDSYAVTALTAYYSGNSDNNTNWTIIDCPNVDELHYRWRNDDGGEATSTWLAVEDTATGTDKNVNIRVRFSVKNSVGPALNYYYRIQISKKGTATCEQQTGGWSNITTTTDSNVAVMTTSSYFSDGATTTRQLSTTTGTFVSGQMVAYPSNQTSAFNLNENEFTEHEYVFKFTNNATEDTVYCLRLSNSGTALDSYTKVAQITVLPPILNQRAYIFQNDDGADVNSNSTTSEINSTSTEVKKGQRIIVRFQIDNTGSGALNYGDFRLQYDKNDSNWQEITSSSEILTSFALSGSTGDDINATAAGNCYSTTAWQNGKFHENTQKSVSYSLGVNKCTELAFTIETSNASLDTTYRFRLYNNRDNKLLDNYLNFPALNIVNTANDTKKYSKDSSIEIPKDLKERIGSSLVGGSSFAAVYDYQNKKIYLGGSGKFAVYDPSTDIVTEKTSKISSFWETENDIRSFAFDFTNSKIYLGGGYYYGGSGKFAVYDPSSDTATDKTSKISSFCTSTIYALAFDSSSTKIYLGCADGKFGVYNPSSDTATDKTEKISGFWGSNNVYSLTFDSSSSKIYLGGGSGKFAVYDPSSDTATDKTSKISGFWSSYAITALTFDSVNTKIYLGSEGPSEDITRFAVYDPSSDTATDKTEKISSFWGTNPVYALTFDSTNAKIYLGGSNFAVYDPSSDTATDKTSKISGGYIYSLTFDSTNIKIYLGGGSGKFAVYDPSLDTATDKTSKISGFWWNWNINALTFDSSNTKIYLGGDYSKFAVYDPSLDTATDKTSKISGFWWNWNINALTFDSSNTKIYLGGGYFYMNSRFAVYNPSSDTATDKNSKISSFWGNWSPVYALTFDSSNTKIYLGGGYDDGGRFAVYDPSSDTATDKTSKISSFWGTSYTSVNALTFDSSSSKIYLGGTSGRFAVYDSSSDTATDKTEKISGFCTSSVYALAFDSANTKIYLGCGNGKFGVYDPSSDTATDKTSKISSFCTSTIYDFTFDSANTKIYLGCGDGKFGVYDPSSDTATDKTSKISSLWSSNNVYALTLDSTNKKIYLGGEVANFASFNPGSGFYEKDLTYYLDKKGYSDTLNNDANLDPITSATDTPIFLFVDRNSTNTEQINVTWIGQSNVSASTNKFNLDVYRLGSINKWVNATSNSSCATNTDCTISYSTSTNLSEYYKQSGSYYWTYFRIYQDLGNQTLKTNRWQATYGVGINISGYLYSGEGTGPLSSKTIRLKVNSTGNSTTSTDGSGYYSFTSVSASSSDTITVYVSGDATYKGTTVTVTNGTTSISDMNIYANHIIVRDDNTQSGLTISNMAYWDKDNDSDVQFTASTGTPDTLVVDWPNELYIWSTSTGKFKPNGNVTTHDLEIASATSTYTASATESINVSGSWINSGTFTSASSTLTFNSTTTETIVAGSSPFWILTFNGSGGEWQISTNTLDVNNNLNITLGTLNAGSQNINVAGNLTLSSGGLFTKGTGTTTFDGSSTNIWTDSNASKQDMGNVSINGSSKTINLGSDIKATKLTIVSGNTFGAGGYTFTITGSGTGTSRPFIISGTFNASTSLAEFTGTSTTDVESTTYYNLKLNSSSTTFQLYNIVTTTNDINIATGTLDVTAANYNLFVGGNWTNTGTFTCQQGTVTFNSTTTGKTITDGGWPFYQILFNGSGGEWLYKDSTSTAPATTTVQAGTSTFLNAKTGNVSVTGGTLNVDWYLGAHVVDKDNTSYNIGNATCTISSTSTATATIYKMSGGSWQTASTSQWTVTYATGTATGTTPQPNSDGAIRFQEYQMTSATTTFYKYNLTIPGLAGFGSYDYYSVREGKYLTSTSSPESGVDKTISEDWYRVNISQMNSPYSCPAGTSTQCINQPPSNGSWYIGMSSDLEFSVDSLSVNLGELSGSNNFTATGSTRTYATTSATNGYVITAWADWNGRLKHQTQDIYIEKWTGTNSTPTTWGSEYNYFGYTTDDTTLSGDGGPNRFSTSTKYAGFDISQPNAKPVADKDSPATSGDQHLIIYRVVASIEQVAGLYQTSIYYICTAQP
jgi:hypothetical protein